MKRNNRRSKAIAKRDPVALAEYVSACEVINQSTVREAREWLELDVHMTAAPDGSREPVALVLTARDGREARAPVSRDALMSPSALRQQIVKLAHTLDGKKRRKS